MKSRSTHSGSRREVLRAGTGAPGRTGRLRRAPGALLLPAALLPLLGACSDDHVLRFPQTTFATVTDYGDSQMWLFNYTLILGVIVGVLVFAVIGFILWKFRYHPDAPEPKQIHGNTTLEVAWTLIPAVIVALIAVPTVRVIFDTWPQEDLREALEADPNAVVVEAIGKQWWWEFRYPYRGPSVITAAGDTLLATGDTIVTANEMHLPVGQPALIKLLSDNVLHSFWFPQMGGKRDMIPNRENYLLFEPEEPGVYLGQCAEFCGDSHALMKMRLVVHSPAGYQKWLLSEAQPAVEPLDSLSAVALGKKLVTQGACAGCHYIEGTSAIGRTGPNLTHFGRRLTVAGGILQNDAHNLAAWLRDPPAIKPGSKMPDLQQSEEEIAYMVAYLQSLQ